MAHVVLVEDSAGELVDVVHYCSNFCAQSNEHYDGWYGCVDLEFSDTCASCGVFMVGYMDGELVC
jgi:hypothetical protein